MSQPLLSDAEPERFFPLMSHRRGIRVAIYLLTALTIMLLSLMDRPPVPQSGLLGWDKLQHALAYAFLTLLGGWAFTPGLGARRAWRRALLLAVTYGGLMEVAQFLLSGRRGGHPADALANALGAAAVFGVARLLRGSQEERQ